MVKGRWSQWFLIIYKDLELVSAGHVSRSALESRIWNFKHSCNTLYQYSSYQKINSEQSLGLVRNNQDKAWVVLGMPMPDLESNIWNFETQFRGQNISILHLAYNFYSPCKYMHLSFKSICKSEHKGVICNMTSTSNFSQSTCPVGWVLWEEFLILSRFHS